ncbi:MAG: cyclic nucleotide-binding domain-containing protein, partial [Anaerolineales bacterium]|nr:cyclic nucleotide-binding domain-containing protein [Anaerolineales bacterium]
MPGNLPVAEGATGRLICPTVGIIGLTMDDAGKRTNYLSPSEMDDLASAVKRLCAGGAPDETILLGQLVADERQNLPELFSERQCAPGQVLFQEGEPGDAMYIILSGSVAVL